MKSDEEYGIISQEISEYLGLGDVRWGRNYSPETYLVKGGFYELEYLDKSSYHVQGWWIPKRYFPKIITVVEDEDV